MSKNQQQQTSHGFFRPSDKKLQDGDPKKGKEIFEKNCSKCHSLDEEDRRQLAPSLGGIVGRQAGQTQFSYSKQMKNSNILWSPDHLYDFLKNPQQYVSGTRMGFEGIKDDKERSDLIAFLNTLQQEPHK